MSFFQTRRDVKIFVCQISVDTKKPFVFDKSEPGRIVVKCTSKACTFKMIFHGFGNGSFHLAQERPHTCQLFVATIKRCWVRKQVQEMKGANKAIKPAAMQEKLKADYKVDVDKALIKNALFDVKRSPSFDNRAFGLVCSFLDVLTRNNEGSTTSVLSLDGIFQRAFLCPGVCSRAFEHTPKIVGLDACHIKAWYGGVMLVMTALDGNGSIFPVALGIAESEKTETWFWFLCLVKGALHIEGDGEGIVFLSDREKGIETSVQAVFPRAAHGFCVWHMQKNVKVHHHTNLKGLLFKAAHAGTGEVFNDTMAQMRAVHPAAAAYVKEIEAVKWSRAFFPMRRFGHVTSNIAESANKWLEEARYQDPVGLFSTYIRQINVKFEKRRTKYTSSPEATLPKRVFALLSQSVKDSRTLDVRRHTRTLFEVQRKSDRGSFRVVDLQERTCTCSFYKEYGVPCRHVCAAVLSTNEEPAQFVVPERRREALLATYVGVVRPVDMSTLTCDGTLPPVATKQRGRPKQKRIPSFTEKMTKKRVKCGKCGELGHNSRTCKKQSN